MALVLITGERDWPHVSLLEETMDTVRHMWRGRVHFIFGDCPTGADALALSWCVRNDVPFQRVVADWNKHGKRAGPLRNGEMVKAHPIMCVAFWSGRRERSGTLDCITQAVEAGIQVRIVPKGFQV